MATRTKSSLSESLTASFETRVKHTLRKTTPKQLKLVTAIALCGSILGLTQPLTAVVCTFFGVVESMRLSRPQVYPFPYNKRLFYLLRAGTALYLIIGIVGIILNWSDIYNFLEPLFDWINA